MVAWKPRRSNYPKGEGDVLKETAKLTRIEAELQRKYWAAPGFIFLREELCASGGQSNRIRIYLHHVTQLEFVLVPGGRFTMGSPPGALFPYRP